MCLPFIIQKTLQASNPLNNPTNAKIEIRTSLFYGPLYACNLL